MEVRTYTAEQLLIWIESSEFKQMDTIPISEIRGVSHAMNPCASTGDILLICIFENGSLSGYLGILPDILWKGLEKIKIGWLSCLWIKPEIRGKGIARKLVASALSFYENRIILTDFTETAKQSYLKSGFFGEEVTVWGTRGYLKSELRHILPIKKDFFRFSFPLLSFVDALLNLIFYPLRKIAHKRFYPVGLRVEPIKSIDNEVAEWIQSFQKTTLFRRNNALLDWIIQYPWVKESRLADKENTRYFFTSVATTFRQFFLKVRGDSGEIRGFIMLLNRNGHLKVPYAYFHPQDTKTIGELIVHYALLWDIHTLTVFHPALSRQIEQTSLLFIFRKRIAKGFMMSKKLEGILGGVPFVVQAGDGDAAFT